MHFSITSASLLLLLPYLTSAAPHINKHGHLHALKRAVTTVDVTEVSYTTIDVTQTIYVDAAGNTVSVSPPESAPNVIMPTPTPASTPSLSTPAPIVAAVPSTSSAASSAAPPPPAAVVAPPAKSSAAPPPPPPSSTPPPPSPPPATTPPPPAPVVAPSSAPVAAAAVPVVSQPSTGGSGGGSGTHFSGDLTHYDPTVGAGSCGKMSAGTEHVVALAHGYMSQHENGNPNANTLCGKTITISLNGKTTTATIVDKCMGCEGMSIDGSDPVFSDLASLDAGRVQVQWWLN